MYPIAWYGYIRKPRSEIYYNRPDQNISGSRFKPIHDLLLNNINWNEDFSAAEEIHVTLGNNTYWHLYVRQRINWWYELLLRDDPGN